MTMGPPQAEDALRVCLALGADRVHPPLGPASSRSPTRSAPRGRSRWPSQKEGADLVLCGREDARLGDLAGAPGGRRVPRLAAVDERDRARGGGRQAARPRGSATRARSCTSSSSRPSCSVTAPPDDAELESAAEDGEIDVWTATDLVDDAARRTTSASARPGSPTRVLAVRDVTPERDAASSSPTPPKRPRADARSCSPSGPRAERPGTSRTASASKPGAAYDCWTVVETVDGRAARVSLELLAKGRELAGKLGGDNVALVLGHDVVERRRRARAAAAPRRSSSSTTERSRSTSRSSGRRARPGARERERPHVLADPGDARTGATTGHASRASSSSA